MTREEAEAILSRCECPPRAAILASPEAWDYLLSDRAINGIDAVAEVVASADGVRVALEEARWERNPLSTRDGYPLSRLERFLLSEARTGMLAARAA